MDLLNFLFPRRCVSCRKLGYYFCGKCRLKIKYINIQICPVCEKPAIDGMTHPRCRTRYCIDGLISFFRYEGPIKKALKLLKYRFVSDLTKEFIDIIPSSSFNNLTMKQFNNGTMFIPIPLHSKRLRFRGFNQVEVLGRILVKRIGITMKSDILKRIIETTPQVEMKDREKRLKNMEKVFSVAPNILISSYPNIILFDDVFTTGATLRSAAKVLKRAGAKFVWGVTLAHG